MTDEIDETKTYCISPNSLSKTADLLIMIEVLRLKGDMTIKTDRIETTTEIKLNSKR